MFNTVFPDIQRAFFFAKNKTHRWDSVFQGNRLNRYHFVLIDQALAPGGEGLKNYPELKIGSEGGSKITDQIFHRSMGVNGQISISAQQIHR